MGIKESISWADFTWNPVIGCKNNCPYCYARKMNARFHFVENWNKPEWNNKNFEKSFPIKPCRIFVNSMSDIDYWEPEWMERVLGKIRKYPQHQFIFLTKSPHIYENFEFSNNILKGVTNDKNNISTNDYVDFKSYEPLQEDIIDRIGKIIYGPLPKWVIIGAETGNRKWKIIPKKEWIDKIVDYCKNNNIPLFMKNSLFDIMDGKLIQEYPEKLDKSKPTP